MMLKTCLDSARNVPGDYIEFGVFAGESAVPIARAAQTAGKVYHGVDGFRGMGKPGPRDYDKDGGCWYPAGKFSGRTVSEIEKRLRGHGVKRQSFCIWCGMVPDVLATIAIDKIAFAYVDLDHYAPTKAALDWVLARLSPGGIMLCDDWTPSCEQCASGAINEFIEQHPNMPREVKGRMVAFTNTGDLL